MITFSHSIGKKWSIGTSLLCIWTSTDGYQSQSLERQVYADWTRFLCQLQFLDELSFHISEFRVHCLHLTMQHEQNKLAGLLKITGRLFLNLIWTFELISSKHWTSLKRCIFAQDSCSQLSGISLSKEWFHPCK